LVNAQINKEPLIFELFNEVDRLRSMNISLLISERILPEQGLDHADIMEASIKAKKEQNDKKIAQLHHCLEMVVDHKDFNTQCLNLDGHSVVDYLVQKLFEPEYLPILEQALPSKSTQPILAAILKRDPFLCNRVNEEGWAPLHCAATIPMSDEDASDDTIDYVKSGRHALETIETLVHAGADINSVIVGDKVTALHCAAPFDLTKTSLLIALGANPTIKDKNDQIPADISENQRVIAILNNPQEHVERINNLILKNSIKETTQPSFFKLVNERSKKQLKFNPTKSLCPYTQAVLEDTKDISPESMLIEMGYQFAPGDEDSQSEFFDEDTIIV
jgi:hypothetical protein